MRKRYLSLVLVTTALLLSLFVATATLAQSGTVYVVRPGDTLSSVARQYGVSPAAVANANGLLNPNLIFVGQRLTIPGQGADGETIHVVARGETLYRIARRYGVDPLHLATYNGISNSNLIFVGQKLRIPGSGGPIVVIPTSTPRPTATVPPQALTPTPTVTPAPAGCQCEEIVIASPARGMTITSPVQVTGLASGFEQTVVVAVLDGSGGQIGLAPGMIVGEYGQQGTFTATVPFTLPANSQLGRIQVWSESPRDGAIEHLNSVTVMIQGLDLDQLLEQLESAIKTKDYAALPSLMTDPFQLDFYQAESLSITPAEAVQRLRDDYLGPGVPFLDFSVNARDLLDGRVDLEPDIIHVVYSPGWGEDRSDDAFLLIGNVGGRARWVGMLYVKSAELW